MLSKEQIKRQALDLGFSDTGFTTVEPFESQIKLLEERGGGYAWLHDQNIDLTQGTDPKAMYPEAKSIIVLLHNYFTEAFPRVMEGNFGRCYIEDDRRTRDDLAIRIKQFRSYLRDNGIESKMRPNMPEKLAAARAGLGTMGKNCLFFANESSRGCSWVSPLVILVDTYFEPDPPTVVLGCPDWCRNACIAACPTGALKGPGKIEPNRCISYLTYFGEDITPIELREPMGVCVYGCDRCQDVCPRNSAWKAQELSENQRAYAKKDHFDLRRLLHMDVEYFKANIQPHMFYMSSRNLWKWKMNVARAMGNSKDRSYVSDLIRAFNENDDERLRGMIAWALGRLGGQEAREALEQFKSFSSGIVLAEIEGALRCRLQFFTSEPWKNDKSESR